MGAKRSEMVKCNCPACGTGLYIDLDDLSVQATGDFVTEPKEKTAGGVDESTGGSAKQKDSSSSSAAGPGEAATEKNEAGGAANGSPANDAENDENLNNW